MTSKHYCLLAATLIGLSSLACIAGAGEELETNNADPNNTDSNNTISNNVDSNNVDQDYNTNPNKDDVISDELKDLQNRGGASTTATPAHIKFSGVFEVKITDGDKIYTPTLRRMDVFARCHTYGEDNMTGFTLDTYFDEDGAGLGLAQTVVRTTKTGTWNFGVIRHQIDAPENKVHLNFTFKPAQDPEINYVSLDGEVALTELSFEPRRSGNFEYFDLKTNATVNLGVYDAQDQLLRKATATLNVHVPLYESLEGCF